MILRRFGIGQVGGSERYLGMRGVRIAQRDDEVVAGGTELQVAEELAVDDRVAELFVGLLVAVAVSTVLTSCRNWLVDPKAVPAATKRSGITSMIVT